jgi:hypothetical protein
MADYAVKFDIQQQEKYDRVHVVIRIVLAIVLGAVLSFLQPAGFIGGIFYLAVPVVAAILIAQKGAAVYVAEREQNMAMWLRWLFALGAYFNMLTDRLPNQEPKETLRYEVTPDGEPSAGNVLLRIILAIPHGIVLFVLTIVAVILIVIAAIMVVIQEKYPAGIFSFLLGYARWNVRVYSYLAGLVQAYPPFAFDTGPEGPEPVMAGVSATPPPPASSTGAHP